MPAIVKCDKCGRTAFARILGFYDDTGVEVDDDIDWKDEDQEDGTPACDHEAFEITDIEYDSD